MSKEVDHISPRLSRLRNLLSRSRRELSNDQDPILSLSSDAQSIADTYSEHLGNPKLKEPLELFLHDLGKKPLSGLRGVALVAWKSKRSPSPLSLYALMGHSDGTPSQPGSIDSEIFTAHDALSRQLEAQTPPISSGLTFVETIGQNLTTFRERFKQQIESSDPYDITGLGKRRISKITIAKAETPVESINVV